MNLKVKKLLIDKNSINFGDLSNCKLRSSKSPLAF